MDNNITMDTENQSFILPLENIDIGLLPNYFEKKKKEEAVPIWSMSNLDSRCSRFYEFQVLAERNDDEEEPEVLLREHLLHFTADYGLKPHDFYSVAQGASTAFYCGLETINMVTCHICNIEIPFIYLKEHYDSAKHKIFTQIADYSLERIKKQMFGNYEVPTKNNNAFYYYCDPCALAIKIKDKEIHENSEEHSNSVTYDSLLNGLSMIYSDKNKLEDFFKLGLKISNEKPEMDLKNKHAADELKTFNSTELNIYVKEICSLYETEHSLTVAENNLIEIKVNERRVKVAVDNFHGFHTVGDRVRCMLCRDEIADELTHMYVVGHVNKIMAPLIDEHYIRELGNIKHCIICNEIVDSTHLSSIEHNIKLQKAIIGETSNDKEEPDSENYCKVCDMILPIGQTADSTAHKNTHTHRLYLSQTKLHYHLRATDDPNIVSCKICYLPVKYQKMHLESKKHKIRYNSLVEINKIEQVDESSSFCQVCCIYMLVVDELSHIRGKKHLRNIAKFNLSNIENSHVETVLSETEHKSDGTLNFDLDENCDETDKETAIFKELTDEYKSDNSHLLNFKVTEGNVILVLKNSDEDLNVIKQGFERKNTNASKKPFTDLTKVFYLMERTDNNEILLCKVCQTTLPHTVHGINEHYKDRQHYQNFSKCIHKRMALIKKSDKSIEKNIEHDRIDTKPVKKAPDSNVETNIPSRSNCETKLPVPDSVQSKTKLPASNYGSILQLTTNSESLTSSTPQISMETNNDLKKEGIVKDKDIPHKNNSTITNNYLLAITQNPKELLCHACNAKVPNLEVNIKEHLNGANHGKNYTAMLQKNKLTQVNNVTFFCGYCKVDFTYSQFIAHISTGYHSLFVKSDINLQKAVKIHNSHTNGNETDVKIQNSQTNVNETAVKIQNSQTNVNETAMKIQNSQTNVNETTVKIQKSRTVIETVQAKIHFCAICKVKVPYGDHNVEIHEKGRQHFEMVKEHILKLETSLSLVQEAKKQNYLMDQTKTGELHCKVCFVNIPNSTSSVTIHLNGEPHTKAYNNLLKTHNVTKVRNKFYCHSCNVVVPLSTEINHIHSVNHLMLWKAGAVGDSASTTSSVSSLPPRWGRSRKRKNENTN